MLGWGFSKGLGGGGRCWDRVSPRGLGEGSRCRKVLPQPSKGGPGGGSATFLGGLALGQLASFGHIWTPADLDHICLAKVVVLLV